VVFLSPVIFIECIRIVAFYAARGVHALSAKRDDPYGSALQQRQSRR
jgi:hypothetical protein